MLFRSAWLTTPMAHRLARALAPQCVVYDCADELSAFDGAPAELPAFEAELLARADLVLAAGQALAAPRRVLARERLHVVPNGHERHRFAPRPAQPAQGLRAVHCAGWEAAELRRWALPCAAHGVQIGYAGAIDERLDLPLLAALADARPQWQFVLAGPVLKIDAADLPQRANLHWLGPLPYRLLPGLMARWRLALLPWLQSAATRSAQPLKVLEALAAGLPVVSPPMSELLDAVPAGVHCAAGRAAMLGACEALLAETPQEAAARRRQARRYLQQRDWQTVALQVHGLLRAALAARAAAAGRPACHHAPDEPV